MTEQTLGRPRLEFVAYAHPKGQQRWSEERLRDRWQRLNKEEGHRAALPNNRPSNQWNPDYTEIERRVLAGLGRGWTIAETARRIQIGRTRVIAIRDSRKEWKKS